MRAPASALRPLADCLSLDPDRARTRFADTCVDWRSVLHLSNLELVAPTLASRLARLGGGTLPPEMRDYLALLHQLNGERNVALRGQALALILALNGADIRPVLLKGAAALFADVYGDPAARMIGDLDILVPHERLDASLAVLADLGYRLGDRYPDGHHAYGEFVRPGDAGAVDLHVEPIDASYLLPADEMRSRARSLSRDDAQFSLPCPTDRLLHNILHAQIHHRAEFYRGVFRLRQLHDGAMIARALAPEIDWAHIEARFGAYRLGPALQAYALAAHELFGLPWPLASRPTLGARVHYRRCLLQRQLPLLAATAVPLANLRHGFAWHRLDHLYGGDAGTLPRMARHARQFAHKARARGVIAQLFRT